MSSTLGQDPSRRRCGDLLPRLPDAHDPTRQGPSPDSRPVDRPDGPGVVTGAVDTGPGARASRDDQPNRPTRRVVRRGLM